MLAPIFSSRGRARSSCAVAAADHEGQRAGDGAAGAAGDGRVDEVDAGGFSGLGDLLAGGGGDGRAVDHQRALGDAGQQVAVAQEQAFHVLAGGQHGDDGFGALHGVLRAGRDLQAFGFDLGERVLAQVEGLDAVAGLVQVDGHGAAHVAEADECDLHGVVSWSV
jgi:hypothetical protein